MKPLNILYQLSSFAAMFGWVLLFFLPAMVTAQPLWVLIPVAMVCVLYGVTLFAGGRWDEPDRPRRGHFFSLPGILKLFESRSAVLVGWIHFLAFDLMIGLFIVMDSTQQGISHWMILPSLFFTLMLGPLGLLSYLALRLYFSFA